MFLLIERFGKDISPIKICINFHDANHSLFDLIFEMMPFDFDMFCSGSKLISCSKNNT